jgi:type VI secretion system secreted protein Hcp
MATDYLLVIDGIKGETRDEKHKDGIEVESFSWGASNAAGFATGGGGGAGKVAYQDLHISTRVNKSSPILMLHCATGQHIKKAVLTVRKAGGEQQDYYKITLEDVLVSSYQNGGSAAGDSVPVEQFSMSFGSIKFEYKPQKQDGSLDSAVTAGYDLKANKKL